MKPFNLDRALAGDPVVTRDGRKVENLAFFPKASRDYQVVAHIKGSHAPLGFCNEGFYSRRSENVFDLFMAPKTTKVKVTLYRPEGHNGIICAITDQECAVNFRTFPPIKTIEVEIEE